MLKNPNFSDISDDDGDAEKTAEYQESPVIFKYLKKSGPSQRYPTGSVQSIPATDIWPPSHPVESESPNLQPYIYNANQTSENTYEKLLQFIKNHPEIISIPAVAEIGEIYKSQIEFYTKKIVGGLQYPKKASRTYTQLGETQSIAEVLLRPSENETLSNNKEDRVKTLNPGVCVSLAPKEALARVNERFGTTQWTNMLDEPILQKETTINSIADTQPTGDRLLGPLEIKKSPIHSDAIENITSQSTGSLDTPVVFNEPQKHSSDDSQLTDLDLPCLSETNIYPIGYIGDETVYALLRPSEYDAAINYMEMPELRKFLESTVAGDDTSDDSVDKSRPTLSSLICPSGIKISPIHSDPSQSIGLLEKPVVVNERKNSFDHKQPIIHGLLSPLDIKTSPFDTLQLTEKLNDPILINKTAKKRFDNTKPTVHSLSSPWEINISLLHSVKKENDAPVVFNKPSENSSDNIGVLSPSHFKTSPKDSDDRDKNYRSVFFSSNPQETLACLNDLFDTTQLTEMLEEPILLNTSETNRFADTQPTDHGHPCHLDTQTSSKASEEKATYTNDICFPSDPAEAQADLKAPVEAGLDIKPTIFVHSSSTTSSPQIYKNNSRCTYQFKVKVEAHLCPDELLEESPQRLVSGSLDNTQPIVHGLLSLSEIKTSPTGSEEGETDAIQPAEAPVDEPLPVDPETATFPPIGFTVGQWKAFLDRVLEGMMDHAKKNNYFKHP